MKTKTGIELIGQERRRQISGEGYSLKYDASRNICGELVGAAACYLDVTGAFDPVDGLWPWGDGSWKPSDDRIRNLVKAGALIAAEIDRLQGLGRRSAETPLRKGRKG